MMNWKLSRLVGAVFAVLFVTAIVIVVGWSNSTRPARAQEATPEATSTPTATAETQAAQEDASFAVDQVVVVTTTDGDSLNFRDDADSSAEVIATLPEGTYGVVVDGPVEADDTTWYQIEVDDVTGWVTGEFLGDAATKGTLDADSTVYVNTDNLNLRASAGLDSEELTQLERNTTATVLSGPTEADDYAWYELDVDGTTGWAVRDFLALAPSEGTIAEEASTEGSTLSVNTDELNVRDAAGLDSNILETVAFGDTVTDLGATDTVDEYDWTQVETASGTSGWVASIYVTADSADLSLTVDAVATINADDVNVRDSAGLSGASLGTVNTGDTVTIVSASEAADDLLWYQVETADGTTGWIAGDFLTV